jgi:hypothetical protein
MTYCVAHSTTSTGRAVGGLGGFSATGFVGGFVDVDLWVGCTTEAALIRVYRSGRDTHRRRLDRGVVPACRTRLNSA